MTKRRALIIGAGIAGPVAAVALQQAGFEAELYESHEAGADNVGAFLGLSLNGIDALRAVNMDGPVLERGFATPRTIITNGDGRALADFPNGASLSDGTQAITIARPDLYKALTDQALERGIQINYGKQLVDVRHRQTGVTASFADETVTEGDLLIGADGLRSTTRKLIDPAAPDPTYVGFLNTAGYATGLDLPIEPGINHLVFGRHSFFGYIKHPNGDVWWFANPPRST